MAEMDLVRRAARSRYWREDEARVVVDAWRASGETLAAFCRQHGVAPARVSRWAKQLRRPAPVQFHPVHLRATTAPESRQSFEVELPDGTNIHVPSGFELADLQRILAALAPPPRC